MNPEELIAFEWKDDILICRILIQKSINKEIAKQLVQCRKEACKNQPTKLIMVFPKLTNMDKSGRDYLSSDEAKEGVIAGAMVTTTIIGRVIINFFLKLNNKNEDDIPNKVFNTEEEALEWIQNLP